MVPSSRLLAYYVINGEVVADALNFHVNGTILNEVRFIHYYFLFNQITATYYYYGGRGSNFWRKDWYCHDVRMSCLMCRTN